MNTDIKSLEPGPVWEYFSDLTRIPRPSKKEGRVVEYIKAFGKKYGLETFTDETGNVIIKKPATRGMENRKGVILQGHLDMVPQKNSNKIHDFENDPVEPFIDGGWVGARGTTLGADNGIGVAAALAVLGSDNLVHGPVEALFTIDEEAGMSGAFGLKGGLLDGDILLNLDSEDEGVLYIGCAGGLDANIRFSSINSAVPEGALAFEVKVGGLKGGHSGLDIALGRGNANKLLFRFLKHAVTELDARLASVDGGSLRNAIPREAIGILVIAADRNKLLEAAFNKHAEIFMREYSGAEPGLSINIRPVSLPGLVIDKETTHRLIHGVIACPDGVVRMSSTVPGLVETSVNLARVCSDDETIEIQCLLRSSSDGAMEELAGVLGSVFTLAGAVVGFDGAYPGWKPSADSEILSLMKRTYSSLYGILPDVTAIHAGLECGIIGGAYPGLDMISFGPTIRNPHSPDEKVHIGSVMKFWDFLTETLKNIPLRDS
jgi:dipeptidase D